MSVNESINDTIAAIATASGQGAIGIVRISGKDSLPILSKVFSTSVQKLESHCMYYGKIVENDETVDEVMACAMLAPRSYTAEDTVEIYAHGGVVVLNKVLNAVVNKGARLANPGEFTKRAFLNGRINLTQAEAVMDIISASSDNARRAGLKQLGGGLSRRIQMLRDRLLTWIAHIELSIDYPEHESEAKTAAQILSEGDEVKEALETLHKTSTVGRILRDGIKTVIVGRPNAGKSTLLNAILSEDRAIVHEQAGTTRDVLTERAVVNGVPLLLMDTAGIRDATNPVEKIGVEKTLQVASEAELLLYVVDSGAGLSLEDKELIAKLCDKNMIVLLNKWDLSSKINIADVQLLNINVLQISTLTGQGLDTLYERIYELFMSGIAHNTEDQDIIMRERHRILIEKAMHHVDLAMSEISQNVPEDLVCINLKVAYIALGEVLGEEVVDDIVDKIFEEFCLGK